MIMSISALFGGTQARERERERKAMNNLACRREKRKGEKKWTRERRRQRRRRRRKKLLLHLCALELNRTEGLLIQRLRRKEKERKETAEKEGEREKRGFFNYSC